MMIKLNKMIAVYGVYVKPFMFTNLRQVSSNEKDVVNSVSISEVSDVKMRTKESYIVDQWKADFPSYNELSYEDISSLSSRSKDVGSWFKRKSLEYSTYHTAPDWFLDSGRDISSWTTEVQSAYLGYKTATSEHNKKVNKLQLEFKKQMEDMTILHKEHLVSIIKHNPEVAFEMFNSQMLPLEVHIAAMKFTTKDEAKDYVAKALHSYKVDCYKRYCNKTLSLDGLIELLTEKL